MIRRGAVPIPLAWVLVAVAMASPGPASAPPVCTELVAEKTVVVGQVCVDEAADTLIVRFVAAEGWRLTETHVAVAGSLEGIPRAGPGHPIMGRFPYKTTHAPSLTEFAYAVPLHDLAIAPGGEAVVAAHASVAQDGQEEGAWARGEPFAAQGNPATYFTYVLGSARRS